MSKTMKQIIEEKEGKGQFVDKSDPNFDAMKILYQDPVSTLGTWLEIIDESKNEEDCDALLRKDFWYRDRHPKKIDDLKFFEKIDDILECKVKYNPKTDFPEIAKESLAYLLYNMLKPHSQQVKEIWGHMLTVATIKTLYNEHIRSLNK